MKNCSKEKFLYWVSMFTLALTAAFVLYMGYVFLWPQNIMWQVEPIKVLEKTVKPGGFVTLQFDYCKYKNAVGDVSIYLVDSQIFSLRTVKSNLGVGCRNDLKYPIQIPPTVIPGKYYIRETLDYHINPLREVHYDYNSEVFEVVK